MIKGKIDRNGLPLLLNEKNLTGTGAEIGVWFGQFSDWILANSQLSCLFSIDPWEAYDTGRLNGQTITQEQQDEAYQTTKNLLEKYGDRSQIIKKTSAETAKDIADDSLDFIFIDGDHSYDACKQDLEIWYPKLKSGGIFSGHDFISGKFRWGTFGVKDAVTEFANKLNVEITLLKCNSWMFEKP